MTSNQEPLRISILRQDDHVGDPQTGSARQMDLLRELEGPCAEKGASTGLLTSHSLLLTPAQEPPTMQEMLPAQPENTVVLEKDVRLSKSLLWKMQEEYFDLNGIEAWKSSVPFFITSNTIIADTYAELVLSYLRDCRPTLNVDEPVYILEMAAGSGRLAYLLLRALEKKRTYFEELAEVKIQYIMTDFSHKIVDFWQGSESLKPFVDQGLLDFAIYRGDEYDSLKLLNSGLTLTNHQVKNPLIAIGNYYFDTIRHDTFRIQDGRLQEGLMTSIRNMDGVAPGSPVELSQIDHAYQYRDVRSPDYYQNPKLDKILGYYPQHFAKGHLIFPIGALNCVQNLQKLSNNNLVLISSDKGYTEAEFVAHDKGPYYASHGSFSYLVNYDAVCKYFEYEGGVAFRSSNSEVMFNTIMTVMGPAENLKLANTRYSFAEKVERRRMLSAYCTAVNRLADQTYDDPRQGIDTFIEVMRMTMCDPMLFCRFAQNHLMYLPVSSIFQRHEVIQIIKAVQDNFYYFPGERDLPFWIGMVLWGIDLPQEAVPYFHKNLECYGDEAVVHCVLGKCYQELGQLETALHHYKACLALDPYTQFPKFSPEMVAELEEEVARRYAESVR
jgi:tetratricopeptide (TPR) repeat protein